MKKVFLLLMCVLLISGCSNNKEEVKVIPSSTPTSTVEPTSTPIEKEEKKEKDKVNMNNYVSYNGNLKLDGVNLVNQYGEKIQLKGISSHGLQWFNYLITDTNIKTIKSWGSNVFRLAMYTKEGGYIDSTLPFYSGKTKSSILVFNAGFVLDIIEVAGKSKDNRFNTFGFYIGGGYGKRQVLWETTDGQWIKYRPTSYSGFSANGGLIGSIYGLTLKLGINSINFKYHELEAGIGWMF